MAMELFCFTKSNHIYAVAERKTIRPMVTRPGDFACATIRHIDIAVLLLLVKNFWTELQRQL